MRVTNFEQVKPDVFLTNREGSRTKKKKQINQRRDFVVEDEVEEFSVLLEREIKFHDNGYEDVDIIGGH